MIETFEKQQQMKRSVLFMTVGVVLILISKLALANVGAQSISWQKEVRAELSKRFSGARIAYLSDWQWKGQEITTINRVVSISENSKGEVTVELEGTTVESTRLQRSQVVAAFSAKIRAFVATRRIQPQEKLTPEIVSLQEIDVTQGMNAEIRGMLLTQDQEKNIANLETRQTLLENQAVVTTAVQKIHDIKKGDPVRVKLISGDVILNTSGISSESGYRDGMIHVLTLPSKKDIVGKFVGNGMVEVRL